MPDRQHWEARATPRAEAGVVPAAETGAAWVTRVLMALFTTIDLAYECRLAFFRGHYAAGSRKLPRSVDSLVASGGTIWNASVCLLASGVRAT